MSDGYLFRGNLKPDAPVDFGRIYPLGTISAASLTTLEGSIDGTNTFKLVPGVQKDVSCRYLSGLADGLSVSLGQGYYAIENPEMTDKFVSRHGWSGADGIYSFNIEDGKDDYGNGDKKTLFVFGDTLVGEVAQNGRRIEPVAMVNSSLAYYQRGKLDFVVNRGKQGELQSIFEVPHEIKEEGYLPKNLVDYSSDNPGQKGYVCALDEKRDIDLVFDLHGVHPLSQIGISNFHDDNPGIDYGKRGVQRLRISSSQDGVSYSQTKVVHLKPYSPTLPEEKVAYAASARYLKLSFHPGPQFQPLTENDHVCGLSKVRFYDATGEQYFDVGCTSNSLFFPEEAKKWFWLQDGVVYQNHLYLFPVVVEEDLRQVEGYQFKISGVCGIKCPIEHGEVAFRKAETRSLPFYGRYEGREYILPSAVYDNHENDGYCYCYGYYFDPKVFCRYMIVGRIKIEELDDMNNLRYYDGTNWVRDLHQARPILDHVSTEMSVQPIASGFYKGKYLAIFDYDTNTNAMAYAIGDSLVGPFGRPRVFYLAKETAEHNKETYTYNAKSHLHLSTPDKILVSYNCNDMILAHNKADFTLYHPRFLTLLEANPGHEGK